MGSWHLTVRRKGVGDTIAISPLIRALSRQFPDSRLSVEGTLAEEIFQHDRRVDFHPTPDARTITIDYKATHDRGRYDRTARYLEAGLDDFTQQTGIELPRERGRPSLRLSDREKVPPEEEPYIVVASGAKLDIPLKLYSPVRWQEVVDLGRTLGWRFKQVGRTHDHRFPHIQNQIRGCESLLDRTSLRELFYVIRHAAGVICHTSLPMLIASAFRRPCVVVGGGREDPWLFDDMGVTYLHTIGRLSCCERSGCRTVYPIAVNDAPYPPGTLCADPVPAADLWVGRCMTMIEPEEIISSLAAAMDRRPS